MEQFGELIKHLRKQNKMTQGDLASQLKLTTSAISKWETGQTLPDISMIQKIADLFEISIEDLYHPSEYLLSKSNVGLKENTASLYTDTNKSKKHVIAFILILLSIILILLTVLYFHKKTQTSITPIACRTIADDVVGTVYEVAYVYTGNYDELTPSASIVLEYSYAWKNNTTISPDIKIIKISFYDNKEDAKKWDDPQKSIYVTR